MGKNKRWISATVNETYSADHAEGISNLKEGDTVILEIENGKQTWHKS